MRLLMRILDFLERHIPWIAKKRNKDKNSQPPDTNYPLW